MAKISYVLAALLVSAASLLTAAQSYAGPVSLLP